MAPPDLPDDGWPADSLAPGWRPHPQHVTVERYWDGAGWTGEHRFAPCAVAAAADDGLRPGSNDAVAGFVVCALSAAWLVAALGLPAAFAWVWIEATSPGCDDGRRWALGLGFGIATTLVATACAARAAHMLRCPWWAQLLIGTSFAAWSLLTVFHALNVVAFLCALVG